nr:MAG TPA: hypothetical protein [Caudoviricetes sp.]
MSPKISLKTDVISSKILYSYVILNKKGADVNWQNF